VALANLENREGETNCPMHTRYTDLSQHLIDAILTTPGEIDPTLRRAIEEQSAQWSSSSPRQVEQVPPELVTYVKKVALYAYKTTDEDVEALRKAGYDEDAIFEITLSAALGAGMTRLEHGLAALKGDTNASQKD
jgi:alkylhydroperoxidase family enzyme